MVLRVQIARVWGSGSVGPFSRYHHLARRHLTLPSSLVYDRCLVRAEVKTAVVTLVADIWYIKGTVKVQKFYANSNCG